MKKTIGSIALLMSAAQAHAFIVPTPGNQPRPRPRPVVQTYCLSQQQTASDGSMTVGSCDESERNQMMGSELMENGCAQDQVAIKAVRLQIKSCPTAAQL